MAIISRRAAASSPSSSRSTSKAANHDVEANKSVRRRAIDATAVDIAVVESAPLQSNTVDPLRGNHAVATPTASAGAGAAAAGSVTTSTTIRPQTAPTISDSTTTAMPYAPLPTQPNLSPEQAAAERERIRAEFYATYDVMTGVRIAATLGGFFGLMVFLIVWKSRSSSNETLKVLKDPKMAAVAAVCMQEEEEREIQEAIVATGMSIYPDEYDEIVYRRQRMLSLGNVSAPPLLNRSSRFSSVGGGGYSSLLAPPRRFSYSAVSAGGVSLGAVGGSGIGGAGTIGGVRRRSGSESSRIFSNYPMGGSFGTDDYFVETEDELEHEEYLEREQDLDEMDELDMHKRTDSTKSKQGFLAVPPTGHDSRRSSAMTCCSTDSSYLERRCSAYTLGMSNLPPTLQRKLSTASRTSSIDNWDYYYPDIQVIQPTPKTSPHPSERSIYEQLKPPPTTTKTVEAESQKPAKTTMPDKGNGSGMCGIVAAGLSAPTFVRKHSIVSYDPDSAQAGRKQQIHSISADTVDVYPYNQHMVVGTNTDLLYDLPQPIQSAPPTSVHQAFHFTDSPTEELRLGVRRKIAVMELQRLQHAEPLPVASGNGNGQAATSSGIATTGPGTSSSISIDSTPVSMDKLNGSGSLGTISGKALFNVEKRAPLASLSSFKISSFEYQDSDIRSLGEDSVFLESAADTDEDMQQMSSDSEEVSLGHSTSGVAAAMVHHDGIFSRENTILRAPSTTTCTSTAAVQPAECLTNSSMRPQQQQNQQPALRYPVEKRYSLGASALYGGSGSARHRRPLLQRHRTISATSSDRVSLIGQPLQEFQASGGGGDDAQANTPLETHFGAVICTSSPPTHPRRAQLLQQYSDPQSLPTTTTTTTTTTTEDDTCSTLNTEVGLMAETAFGGLAGGGGSVGGESTTHTQYSSLNTVISIGRSSPLTDNNLLCSSASASCISAAAEMFTASASELPPPTFTSGGNSSQQLTKLQQQQKQPQPQQLQQLPHTTRLADDPCASSISDSVISTRQPSICMPASLKNLILRGSNQVHGQDKAVTSKSATNLSAMGAGDYCTHGTSKTMPAVVLELPLIKLPTDESSDSASLEDVDRSRSSESRDPSLPGSARKWSKETLF